MVHQIVDPLDLGADLLRRPVQAVRYTQDVGLRVPGELVDVAFKAVEQAMEMMSPRNFENYRLRVLTHCGWNGIINRV